MPSQSGYVFRRKENGKLGKSWFVRYADTFIIDGVQVRKQVCKKLPVEYPAYRTEASVRPFVDEILGPIRNGSVSPNSNMTVAEFVERIYFPYVEGQVRQYSYKTYKHLWSRHLLPRIGKVTLRDFRTVHGQQMLADIARPQTLSMWTLRHLKNLLSAIFNAAKNLGYLDGANPITGLKIPRQVRETEPTHAYSMAEVDRILASLDGQARLVVLTASLTGLRKSELRGIRWKDFTGRELFVRRSVVEGDTNETKNASSKAPIPVIKRLADALEAHRLTLGVRAAPDLPIFQAGNTKPLNLDNVARREIKPAIEKCVKCHAAESAHKKSDHPYELDKGTKFHGLHAFRRGLATNLHALGVDDKTIQAILRHSNIQVTQNIYIKTVSESQISAMETLNTELQRRDACNEMQRIPVGPVN